MDLTTVKQEMRDYGELLQIYGVRPSNAGLYWQVGDISLVQGWILHLSVIGLQVIDLLKIVVPFLLEKNVAFKIIRNKDIVSALLDGGLGYAQLGKVVSIYPTNDKEAENLAKELVRLTNGFKGPEIPTDFYLGEIVYTRYGSFNPKIVIDPSGEPIKYIYDASGKLIPDPYTIPFRCPEGVKWPFERIRKNTLNKPYKLLNQRYYPLQTLKPDVKGFVIRGLYFRKWNNIRNCLIKQGRKWMVTDAHGRDIRDRLRWQYNLYMALKDHVPMPEVFDLFEQGSDTYLAMAFIKGVSIGSMISLMYNGRSWRDISNNSKKRLLNHLLTIINIVQHMHEQGYVHRDINSNNFMIDGDEKIWLIDLELAWSIKDNYPNPAFLIGSPGYMSPEQHAEMKPTIEQDIYSVGALAAEFLTGLYPLKLNQDDQEVLLQSITFLSGEERLAAIITACHAKEPANRPTLEKLRTEIVSTIDLLEKSSGSHEQQNVISLISQDWEELLGQGIKGLSHPSMYQPIGIWLSARQREEKYIGNHQIELDVYEGWHTGMAGPMWLVSRAVGAGIEVNNCMSLYWNSFDRARQYLASPIANFGLYNGTAGLAFTIVEGIESGVLENNEEHISLLERCFTGMPSSLTISEGWAGVGLSLLRSETLLESDYFKRAINACIQKIMAAQQKDGSWDIHVGPQRKKGIALGMDNGISGVLWFLLCYLEKYKNENVRTSLVKCLSWLMKYRKTNAIGSSWPISTHNKSIEIWDAGKGMPGISIVFLKAFEILKDAQYRKVAEDTLKTLPDHAIYMDFTLSSGLAGLGEIYCEAYRVTGNELWKNRAAWIAGVFAHCSKDNDDGSIYWLSNINNLVTADFFTGNSGVLHFLLRISGEGSVGHPLWPYGLRTQKYVYLQ